MSGFGNLSNIYVVTLILSLARTTFFLDLGYSIDGLLQ